MNENIVRTETIVIGEYYIEKGFFQMVYNEVKERIQTENRIAARQIQRERNQRCIEDRERRRYFCNQKLYGLLIIIGVIALTLLIGNLACGILALPGLGMMITKKMVIVNDYYWTYGGAEQWERWFPGL